MAIAVFSSLALGAVLMAGSASAAKAQPSSPTADAPHCLAKVIGKSESGEFRLSATVCYATYGDVLEQVGQTVTNKNISPMEASAQGLLGDRATTMSGGTWIIGTHYDGANWSGASFSVGGSDCYGGYLNLTGFWANRVSSTINGCPSIVHYVWPDLVGGTETTTGWGGNLTSLDDISESIAYTGW
jgi:hypothetical protein